MSNALAEVHWCPPVSTPGDGGDSKGGGRAGLIKAATGNQLKAIEGMPTLECKEDASCAYAV